MEPLNILSAEIEREDADPLLPITLTMKTATLPTCRGCPEPILPGEPASEVAAYWQPHTKYPVHKACKTKALKTEAYECQLIDADCNDCRHFERDLTWQKREGSSGGGQPGRCAKFDKPTRAWPKTCTGHSCFDHRRSPDA